MVCDAMSVRANVMLDDAVWEQLQQIPKGERSRLVNEALNRTLELRRRERAMQEMDRLRAKLPRMKVDVVREIRKDRARTHG